MAELSVLPSKALTLGLVLVGEEVGHEFSLSAVSMNPARLVRRARGQVTGYGVGRRASAVGGG